MLAWALQSVFAGEVGYRIVDWLGGEATKFFGDGDLWHPVGNLWVFGE